MCGFTTGLGRAGLRAAEDGPALSGSAESAAIRAVRLDERIGGVPAARNRRRLVPVPHAQSFGLTASARTLLFGEGARVGTPRFDDWFKRGTAQAPTRGSHPVSEVSHT